MTRERTRTSQAGTNSPELVRAEIEGNDKRRLAGAAFAVTTHGTLLVNVAHFDHVKNPLQALEKALSQPGNVFIGVAVTVDEIDAHIARPLEDATCEMAAYVVGGRQRRGRESSS